MKKRQFKIYMPIVAALLTALLLLASCTAGKPDETTALPEEVSTEPVVPEDPGIAFITADGTTDFLVIRSESMSKQAISAVTAMMKELKQYAKEIELTTDWDKNPQKAEYELLIGRSTREGNGMVSVKDYDALGENGYIIKFEGTKLVITGGDSGITAALERFTQMVKDAKSEDGVILPSNLNIVYSPSAVFNGIKINGKLLSSPQIGYSSGDTAAEAAAAAIKTGLFSKLGTVAAGTAVAEGTSAGGNIILKAGDPSSTSVVISVSNGDLVITGNSRTGYYRGFRDWVDSLSAAPETALSLDDGYSYTVEYGSFVCYEDFGAAGDGKTDDQQALIKAHENANAQKLPVLGREGADYYIGGGNTAAVIRTDTDWSIAKFTFDDRKVETVSKEVFFVPSEYGSEAIQLTSLSAGQTTLQLNKDYKVLVTAVNSNVKQYIRYGANQNSGASMQDIFVVNADGSIDPSTPILWNFETVTAASIKRIEEDKLTIKGGIITTIANAGHETAYYYRGIRIYRSNTVVDGLKHYVTGEGADGQPYYGILIFNGTVDCEVRNVTFTGHKTYKKIGSAGTSVSMGTYDITVTSSTGFKAIDCNQTNDINNSTYWGVFASNYCKNIYFDGCVFSRFDAHQGVCNVTLKNSKFGHQGINLIGHGTALIENCTVYSTYFVNLRSDYGSTWNGDLIIRNCGYYPKNGEKADAILIGGSFDGTHWFGYDCYLPRNILIDGLYISDTNPANSSNKPAIFANINKNYTSASYKPAYGIALPESINIKGLTVASGKELTVSSNTVMFGGVVINYQKDN